MGTVRSNVYFYSWLVFSSQLQRLPKGLTPTDGISLFFSPQDHSLVDSNNFNLILMLLTKEQLSDYMGKHAEKNGILELVKMVLASMILAERNDSQFFVY